MLMLNKYLKFSFLMVIVMFASQIVSGQSEYNTKAKIVFHVSKLIQWPALGSEVTIGAVGKSPTKNELKKLIEAGATIQSKKTKLNQYEPGAIGKCDILLVLMSAKNQFSTIKNSVKGKNTLIITEWGSGIEDGGCINIIISGGKVKIELSENNLSAYGLKAQSSLKKLAVLR